MTLKEYLDSGLIFDILLKYERNPMVGQPLSIS